jgi:predicted acyltransferase
MAPRFIDFGYATNALFDGVLKHTDAYKPLLVAIAVVAVKWLLLYWLYRKRIFLKV